MGLIELSLFISTQAQPQKLRLKDTEESKLSRRLNERAERIIKAAQKILGGMDPCLSRCNTNMITKTSYTVIERESIVINEE